MKKTQKLMAWLLCCALLMTSANVGFSQESVIPETVVRSTTALAQETEATPTPAPAQETDATPTPAPVQETEATPTPAPEVETAAATPTPAPMQMMSRNVSMTGDSDPSMNPDPLDPNDPGIPTDYTVTYDIGANTAATLKQESVIWIVDTPVDLTPLEDAGGYTFKGWKYIDDIVTSLTMPAAHVTLVAQWEVAAVTVTDVMTPANGDSPDYDITVTPAGLSSDVKWYDGDTAFSGSNYAPGTAYTVKITLTAPDGVTFAASVAAGDYSVARTSNTQIVLSKTFPETDTPIYTVTYDINNSGKTGNPKATEQPEAQRVAVGACVELPTLEDVGSYTFEGWTLNDVKVNSPFTMPDGDVTLKAVWEPVTVTIKYRWNNTDYIFTTETYNVSKYFDVDYNGRAEIGKEANIILNLDKWGRYIYAIGGLPDDGATHIRPVNSSSYRTITINADSSKNVVDVPCYLECTLRPATYELTYDGKEQSVGLITRNVYDNVHGYTANFSNHSYPVGTNPGTYIYDGETVTLQRYIVDSTEMFTTDTIDFVEDLKIVKRPVNITLDPLEYADGSLTSFPKAEDVKYTVAEGDANSGLVSGHRVEITDVKYGLAGSDETFSSTAKPGSYVVKSCTPKIYDENGIDVTKNYEVNVDSPNPCLTIHKGTLRVAVNTPTESTYNGRLTREICPETEPSLRLEYCGKQVAFATEEVKDAGTYCFTHLVAEGEFGFLMTLRSQMESISQSTEKAIDSRTISISTGIPSPLRSFPSPSP